MKKFEDFSRVNQFDLPEIIDPPRICVQLEIPNERYHLRAFWTALYKLTVWHSWAMDSDKRATKVASVWREIWSNAMRNPETFECGCDDRCISYPPNAPFIEWFPNNPYTEPDLVTEGYNSPAWYSVEVQDDFWGTKPGDVATDITRFPPGSLPTILPASGLPRFRINLSAPGLVRLHMVNMIAGSLAQVTIDDDITTVRFLDVNRDVLAVPPETETVSIEEIEVEGEGEHHIDVIIVSQVNDQIPFLHHGGGLRKVEICGEAAEMAYYELRQNPENPCIVEQRHGIDGEWSEAFRMDNCCNDSEPRYRFTEDGILEESVDDGQTWTPAPEKDPRNNPVVIFPPLAEDGETSRCKGANSAVALLIEHKDQQLAAKEAGAGAAEILSLITGLLVGLGVISGGITAILAVFTMALAAFFAGIDAASFAAAFSESLWDKLLCILFCRMSEDGEIPADQIPNIKSDISAQIPSGVGHDWLIKMIDVLGAAGLTNAARSGYVGTRDCDDCQCGDLTCGFSTTHTQNYDRWTIAEELVNTTVFEKPIGLVVQTAGAPVFSALGNQTLAAYTEFEEPCYITTVSMTTLGRSNPGNITVAYKLFHGGEWIDSGTQSYATWAAATVKTFNINAPVVAIQIQSEAFNSGQNNITSVVIADPTP